MPEALSNIRWMAAAACLAAAAPAGAGVLDAGATDRVALDPPKDVAITTVAALGALLPTVLQLGPTNCRWCDGPLGSPVNTVDDWFHAHLTASIFSRNTADQLSSVVAYGVMPAIALGSAFFATGPHATDGAGLRAGFIVVESVAIAGALTQAVKLTAGRQRPYVHYQHVSTPGGPSDYQAVSYDANLSFLSGHTSVAAAAGTSAAMVATLEESPAAPWLWVAATSLTLATGTMRMISESHYFTDVVAGAALGAACGVVVPLLHRRGSWLGGDVIPLVSAGEGGAVIGIAGGF